MTKTIWGTTYTLEGKRTVKFEGDKENGEFQGFDGIHNGIVDFENVCHSHFVNILCKNNQ